MCIFVKADSLLVCCRSFFAVQSMTAGLGWVCQHLAALYPWLCSLDISYRLSYLVGLLEEMPHSLGNRVASFKCYHSL